MKLYAVVFDSYNGGWGAKINCFGIYRTRERAVKRVHHLRKIKNKKHIFVPDEDALCIREITLDVNCEEYLGGYIE